MVRIISNNGRYVRFDVTKKCNEIGMIISKIGKILNGKFQYQSDLTPRPNKGKSVWFANLLLLQNTVLMTKVSYVRSVSPKRLKHKGFDGIRVDLKRSY